MSSDRSKLHHLVPAPWGSNQEDDRSSQTTLPRRVRPKNASRACNECQKRKIKCIGSNPCKNCHENSLFCEVNDETDGRRRFALKRKVEDLEQDRYLLLGLIEALRDDDFHSMRLLNVIRSNASLDEIRNLVHGRMERLSASGPSSSWVSTSATSSVSPLLLNQMEMQLQQQQQQQQPLQYNFEAMSGRKIMDINRLTEIPLFELRAKPWTEVTTDDAFVSHLISLWLTWDHVCRNWVDKDLFIAAMKSGDVNSPFCSPFLVNIILAQACLYSNYPEAYIDPDKLSTRGQHFYNEAKRHLDAMEGRINLTTVQGLSYFFLGTCLMGKDRVGFNYLSQTIHSIRSLVARAHEFIAQAGSQAEDMMRSIGLCVRGIFCFLTLACLSLHTSVAMRPPKYAHLPIIHDGTDTWVTYPYRTPPVPAHRNCIHNQSFELHRITYDIIQFIAVDEDEEPQSSRSFEEIEREVNSFYVRLTNWRRNLPECIQEGQSWTPGVLELHMSYYVYMITLLSFLKVHPSAPPDTAFTAQRRCIASALAVHKLMDTYRSKWQRLEHLPVEYMQMMIVSLFTLLEDLDVLGSRQAFVDLSTVAYSITRRFQLGRGVLRLVQVTARQQNIELPEDVQQIYHDFETEWIRSGGAENFSSSYPSFSLSMRSLAASSSASKNRKQNSRNQSIDDGRGEELFAGNVELDSFLSKWDKLRIDNEM